MIKNLLVALALVTFASGSALAGFAHDGDDNMKHFALDQNAVQVISHGGDDHRQLGDND